MTIAKYNKNNQIQINTQTLFLHVLGQSTTNEVKTVGVYLD